MDKKDKNQRKEELRKCLCSIPKEMIKIHGTGNMTEFLLHHLSQPKCFNLMRAALFVDNPDFDHLRGIAGIDSQAAFQNENHWKNPKDFSKHMINKEFNQKVRKIDKESVHRKNKTHEDAIKSLADELSLTNPSFYSWPLKHENHGIIIFEIHNKEETSLIEEVMEEAAYFFGFCPIF
jgi:hypothetical protein